MISKTVTYKDFNGTERKETFYFNLTEAEVTELQLGTVGGLTDMLQKIVDANDSATLIKVFKDLVLKAYGEKSADGRRFMKSDEIRAAFAETEAYSQIFMELVFDNDAAAKFFNGVIPAGMADRVKNIPAPAPN